MMFYLLFQILYPYMIQYFQKSQREVHPKLPKYHYSNVQSNGTIEKAQSTSIKKATPAVTCRCSDYIHGVDGSLNPTGSPPSSGRYYGVDGSRTRVQKLIHCSSTIIVVYLGCPTFPPECSKQQPHPFSSFILRPMTQSFVKVVSYKVEAWVLKCRCSRSDCCH
jgi:hypothetical protein